MHRELLIKQNDGSWKIWKDGSLQAFTPEQSFGVSSGKKNIATKMTDACVVGGSLPEVKQSLSKIQDSATEQAAATALKSPTGDHARTFVQSIEAARSSVPAKESAVQLSESAAMPVFPQPLNAAIRRKMMDVRSRPAAVGPIDELRFMTLDELRHLGGNIREATAHLSQKMQYLADDSFEQLAAGTQAWRQSPVYRAFLKVIQSSLRARKTVADILPTQELSKDEFMEILNFNRAQMF